MQYFLHVLSHRGRLAIIAIGAAVLLVGSAGLGNAMPVQPQARQSVSN